MNNTEEQVIAEQVDLWYHQINALSYDSIRAKVRGNLDHGKNLHITLALQKYDREQQSKRDELLLRLTRDTLDSQQTGNIIQTKIGYILLGTLFAVIIIPILIAISNN